MSQERLHNEWEEKSLARAAGELSAEESALFDQHVSTCMSCTHALQEYEFLVCRLRSVEKDIVIPAPSPALLALQQEIAQARIREEAQQVAEETLAQVQKPSSKGWKSIGIILLRLLQQKPNIAKLKSVGATLIRVLLAAAGMAFYFFLAFFVLVFMGIAAVINNASHSIRQERLTGFNNVPTWSNRMSWMVIDGWKNCIKYAIHGGNSRLFVTFFSECRKPLIKIAAKYWDQETRRL